MGRVNPEWRSWLGLLEETIRALDDAAWDAAVPTPAFDRPANAPLLHGTTLSLDPRIARRWARKLLKCAAARPDPGAASLARFRERNLDAVALLEAAIRQDHERVRALAADTGADAAALMAVAQLAAMPVLHAARRQFGREVPASWTHGFCPICGAWPVLAEMRGLERARRLRCGRCAADWHFDVLHCPFCDEKFHKNLGALHAEGQEEVRKVDTCSTCKGYLKAVTTLTPLPAWQVPLEDLKTVELDIVALERGFHRPERPGFELDLRVQASARRPLLAFFRRGG